MLMLKITSLLFFQKGILMHECEYCMEGKENTHKNRKDFQHLLGSKWVLFVI
jgi:hypothetical protein